ncbi:MAG: hypothetical protein PVJ02_06055 [Gemmatimonadota bacterium]|jgi:hypothetical protein
MPPESDGRRVEGFGAFRAGVLHLDLDDVNARLGSAGLPGLDANVPVWGGGGYGRVGDVLLGLELHGGLDPSAGSRVRRVSLRGGYGLARARYVIPPVGGVTVYPTLGAGAGALWLRIATPGDVTFDHVLRDPAQSATLSTGVHPVLDVGVGLELRIRTTGGDAHAAGILLGVEAGYMLAPARASWTLGGLSDATGGPDLGIEGFYLWFSLGGWGAGG